MRRRILVATVAVAVTGILVLGLPLAFLARKVVHDDALRRLDREATSVGFAIDDALEHDRTLDQALLDRLAGTDRRIQVRESNGRVVTGGTRVLGRHLTGSATVERHGVVTVTVPARATDRRAVLSMLVVGGLAAAGVAVAVGLAMILARRLGRPVRELALASARLGAGDFSVRAPRSGVAELDAVATALDQSAARIDDLVRAERELATNASHQLRTPLTALRLRLEELTTAADDDVRSEALAALEQADRLASTIDQMLALARSHARADLRSIDIGRLVADRADSWRTAARRMHRSISFTADDGCDATVSAPALAQAVDALIDNALRHGAGTVQIGVERRPRHVEVTIADEGVGVPADAAESVFERHISLRGGTGVGLSLARTLVESFGGRLDLVDPGRARFRMLLPAPVSAPGARL